MSEHVQHFWQVVCNVHNVWLLDHVRTQINVLMLELADDASDIF